MRGNECVCVELVCQMAGVCMQFGLVALFHTMVGMFARLCNHSKARIMHAWDLQARQYQSFFLVVQTMHNPACFPCVPAHPEPPCLLYPLGMVVEQGITCAGLFHLHWLHSNATSTWPFSVQLPLPCLECFHSSANIHANADIACMLID